MENLDRIVGLNLLSAPTGNKQFNVHIIFVASSPVEQHENELNRQSCGLAKPPLKLWIGWVDVIQYNVDVIT